MQLGQIWGKAGLADYVKKLQKLQIPYLWELWADKEVVWLFSDREEKKKCVKDVQRNRVRFRLPAGRSPQHLRVRKEQLQTFWNTEEHHRCWRSTLPGGGHHIPWPGVLLTGNRGMSPTTTGVSQTPLHLQNEEQCCPQASQCSDFISVRRDIILCTPT